MLKVVVKKSEWYCGMGSEHSRLLRHDGCKCCIGFACLAAGLTEEQIRGYGGINGLAAVGAILSEHQFSALQQVPLWIPKSPAMPPEMRYDGTPEWVRNAYVINDDKTISDDVRIEKLTTLGLANGVEFIFVD